jgi:hypothetical protein
VPSRRTTKRLRVRDYAAENAARERRARELGFASDYDRRMRGGAKARPSDPIPDDPQERAERRGHAGRQALLDRVREGDVVMLADHISQIERRPGGRRRYVEIELLLIPEDAEEPERTFSIHNLSADELELLVGDLIDAGAVFSYRPSLDVRSLL